MSGLVVQYVIVRGDLLSQLGWSVGALIAQACHACTAVTHLYRDDDHMKIYLSDLDNMRKVILEADSEKALKELSSQLEEGGVLHKLWIEQPENIPTRSEERRVGKECQP